MKEIARTESILKTLKTLNLNAKQIEQISHMYVDDLIDYLIVTISDLYISGNVPLEMVLDDYAKIIELNKEKYPDIKLLSNRLKWLNEMELTHIGMGLHESHIIISKVFNDLNLALNKNNVEYYHTGGILAYLLTETPFVRFHHDIDVFVDEEKLVDLMSALENSDFVLSTYIGKRDENTNRLVIKLVHRDYPDIPISLFLFERKKDNSIIEKDYYYDKFGNEYVEERYNCPLSSELSFDHVVHYYEGIPYTSISLEALFVCKKGARPKDLYDRKVIEPFVDKKKVELIEHSLSNNYITHKKLDNDSKKSYKKLCLSKKEEF